MHSPHTTRRLLLVLTVLVTVLMTGLMGCATPAVQCGVSENYPAAKPFPVSGEVTIRWDYDAAPANPAAYGDADCWHDGTRRFCRIRMRGDPPSFNDACGLMRLGHEVGHGFNVNMRGH